MSIRAAKKSVKAAENGLQFTPMPISGLIGMGVNCNENGIMKNGIFVKLKL